MLFRSHDSQWAGNDRHIGVRSGNPGNLQCSFELIPCKGAGHGGMRCIAGKHRGYVDFGNRDTGSSEKGVEGDGGEVENLRENGRNSEYVRMTKGVAKYEEGI